MQRNPATALQRQASFLSLTDVCGQGTRQVYFRTVHTTVKKLNILYAMNEWSYIFVSPRTPSWQGLLCGYSDRELRMSRVIRPLRNTPTWTVETTSTFTYRRFGETRLHRPPPDNRRTSPTRPVLP